MYIFFQCVAEAVAEKGLRGVAEFVPGGGAMYDIGTTTRAGRLQSYLYGSYTPLYASPQQRNGDDSDPRDDVHALGVIGYQMLTGQMMHGVGSDLVQDLREQGVEEALIDLLQRCTAQKAERRFKDAAEVVAALDKLKPRPLPVAALAPKVVAKPVESPLPAPAASPSKPRSFSIAKTGCAIFFLTVFCILFTSGAFYWFFQKSQKVNFVEVSDQNAIGMKFARIEPGSFMMGESGKQHRVTLTKAFGMSVHEVTQAQWRAVMNDSPSSSKGDNLPAENVSWDQAIAFCNALSTKYGKKPYYKINGKDVIIEGGNGYRLPTEAEWEYACRAGSNTVYCFGDNDNRLGEFAWYSSNSSNTTHPVGTKSANAWGLHDMHGNVWEWCQDWHNDYPAGDVTDPQGFAAGEARVVRGGSWIYDQVYCRASYRFRSEPGDRSNLYGFRVCFRLD